MLVISVYVLMFDVDVDVKEIFYVVLDEFFIDILVVDNLVLFGDFNVCVGWDKYLWFFIGLNGMGKMNLNGFMLFIKCIEYSLVIINILFCMKDWYKGIW